MLHPLLTNTQLRNHPYKRPLLRRVLTSLISNSNYSQTDPTTRRLVERNLRGSWSEGLTDTSVGEGELRPVTRQESTGEGGEDKAVMGLGWSSGMGVSRGTPPPRAESRTSSWSSKPGNGSYGGGSALGASESNGSTLSIDAVAQEEDYGAARRHRHPRRPPTDTHLLPSVAVLHHHDSSPPQFTSPLSGSRTLEPVEESDPRPDLRPPRPNRQRSSSLVAPRPHRPPVSPGFTESPPPSSPSYAPAALLSPPTPPNRAASADCLPRRRRPPPPPGVGVASPPPAANLVLGRVTSSPVPGQRRAAPEPPNKGKAKMDEAVRSMNAVALHAP